jgi:hypothetical protein
MNGYFNITYDFTNNQKWIDVALKTKSKLQDVQIMALEIMTIAYSSLNRNEFKYEYLGVCCFKYNLSKVKVKKIFEEFLNCNFISKKNENIFYLTDYLIYQSNIKNYQNRTQETQVISKEEVRKQQIREAQARFRSNQKVIKSNQSNQTVIIDNQASNQSVIKSNQDLGEYKGVSITDLKKEKEQDKEIKKINKKENPAQDEQQGFSFLENNFEGKEKVHSLQLQENKNSSSITKENLATKSSCLQSVDNSTRDKSSQLETQFNELWQLYPKKADKQEALKSFKRDLKTYSFEKIKSGMLRYLADVKRQQDTTFPNLKARAFSVFMNKKTFLDFEETKPIQQKCKAFDVLFERYKQNNNIFIELNYQKSKEADNFIKQIIQVKEKISESIRKEISDIEKMWSSESDKWFKNSLIKDVNDFKNHFNDFLLKIEKSNILILPTVKPVENIKKSACG